MGPVWILSGFKEEMVAVFSDGSLVSFEQNRTCFFIPDAFDALFKAGMHFLKFIPTVTASMADME